MRFSTKSFECSVSFFLRTKLWWLLTTWTKRREGWTFCSTLANKKKLFTCYMSVRNQTCYFTILDLEVPKSTFSKTVTEKIGSPVQSWWDTAVKLFWPKFKVVYFLHFNSTNLSYWHKKCFHRTNLLAGQSAITTVSGCSQYPATTRHTLSARPKLHLFSPVAVTKMMCLAGCREELRG